MATEAQKLERATIINHAVLDWMGQNFPNHFDEGGKCAGYTWAQKADCANYINKKLRDAD